jgi:hypothetical protein
MDRGEFLMLVRLLLQVIGGALVARGIGDAATVEAAIGAAVILAGFFWSRTARRQLTAGADAAAKAEHLIAAARAMQAKPVPPR